MTPGFIILGVNFLSDARMNRSFGGTNPQGVCVVTCWKKQKNKQNTECQFVTLQESLTSTLKSDPLMRSQVQFHRQQNHLQLPKAELGFMRAISANMHVELLTVVTSFFFSALAVDSMYKIS